MSNPTPQPSISTPTSASDDIPDYLVPVLAVFDDLSTAAKREHVTTLYCRGYRTAAISTMLGVPVRTLNRWLKDARYLLASEARADREEHLLRAIESARAIAAESWAAYERDCQLHREILAGQHDRLRRRVTRLGRPPRRRLLAPSTPSALMDQDPSAPSPDQPTRASTGRQETSDSARPPSATPALTDLEAPDGDILYEEFERPRHTSQAARLLTLALAAHREVARLQGLYHHVEPPRQPVDVTFSGPIPAAPATSITSDPDAVPSAATSTAILPSFAADAPPAPASAAPMASVTSATQSVASIASAAQSATPTIPASHSAAPPSAAPAPSDPAAPSTPAAPNGLDTAISITTPPLAPASATPQTPPSPPNVSTAPATPASAATPSANPPTTVPYPSTAETG